MPLADERRVVSSPLTLIPDGRGREAFLSQCVHSHDVVTPRVLSGRLVGKRGLCLRIGREPGHGVLVPASVHPVDAVTGDALLRICGPLEPAGGAVLPAENLLR